MIYPQSCHRCHNSYIILVKIFFFFFIISIILRRSGPEPLILSEAEREERFLASYISSVINMVETPSNISPRASTDTCWCWCWPQELQTWHKVEASSDISARASRTRRKAGHSSPHVSPHRRHHHRQNHNNDNDDYDDVYDDSYGNEEKIRQVFIHS